ncbi:MAG: hypothetical protein LBJ00_15785 [Planctomycetaceae bacterium]|nr:hypothetical protein [Planctomycetaceae bacterium]
MELVMEAQQREAVVQGRSLSPCRLRCSSIIWLIITFFTASVIPPYRLRYNRSRVIQKIVFHASV